MKSLALTGPAAPRGTSSHLLRHPEYVAPFTSLEICAGAGGQALGLEQAGFSHEAVVEIDPWAAETLRTNRPEWAVFGPSPVRRANIDPTLGDVRHFDARPYLGRIQLLAGGVPCPPFSHAGKQLGANDERDLFPEALRLVKECQPDAVMLENVRGILDPKFEVYREGVLQRLRDLGYVPDWRLLEARHYGVPQVRPRSVLVALRPEAADVFRWPEPVGPPPTVGDTLVDLMAERGWVRAKEWAALANRVAPTLVGGSKKHGGPDLGPTRARRQWQELHVDGRGVADMAPDSDFIGMPRLTVQMAARIQGFPDEWKIQGRKTAAYRQVGNAFPPPVARAVGSAIHAALLRAPAQRRLAA